MNTRDDLPDFSGKYISISIDADGYNHDLKDPRFEMQGGRLFIIGTVPPNATQSDWSVNSRAGVAWEHVTSYNLFDSEEQYIEATMKAEADEADEADESDD